MNDAVSEKYLKEIAKELKSIRLELEQMNGVELVQGAPKVNFKALERNLKRQEMLKSAVD